ncbi:Sugar or nucleoside kinase, ribokinase family [Georgenia satyanarayanai]|uniref:Sugar or nucleoside kinase, ribokinase family n=1 Tax=Georgenia satyanarayanai TaxID=860221 RepID=A0A2Y9ASD1_9MICO|nr:PfkB family carbohydrate kinase [Georgenia satyanarayanai]PYF95963.1 sugar/nucleoside kinase (ribokinase family) [Georgenia satyanarayanai]SSA47284.1 Sugar or nucleoside kinase, ribokinase family [Georgenia satyanarayanai]
MTGRVVHTGQAIVDVVMRVASIPAPGSDVFASDSALLVGGGFNVMAAARREGAPVVYAGGHGTGPLGDLVRASLRAEGVEVLLPAHPGLDTGFCVALTDDDAERTFVSTVGAEGHVPVDALDDVVVTAGDVVYVSGYSLLHPDNAAMLARALPRLAGDVEVVVDASPVIGDVPEAALRTLLETATVWTVNEREVRILGERVLGELPAGAAPQEIGAQLAERLDTVVLVRVGPGGCWVARRGQLAMLVPGIAVTAVDTNGAGDAHTGVLCAGLCAGTPLEEAVTRANVAAGIAVTRPGPATSPTAAEITARLAR